MRDHSFPRVISDPHPICWAGFKSDTYTLQQNGWEFSAHEDLSSYSFALAMLNRGLGMKGVTNSVAYSDRYAGNGMCGAKIPFYVAWMTTAQIQFKQYRPPEWYTGEPTRPVDMRPQVIAEMKEFEDLFMFAGAPLVRTNELVVDPDNVSAMMDRILELQDPDVKAHFMERARSGISEGESVRAVPRERFHAQIVSLVA